MSNNVRHVAFGSRAEPAKLSEPEPTALQRAVLVRARELRERESEPRKRSPAQWAGAAVLAVVCCGIMYGAVDAVLRKMQHLTKDVVAQPAQPAAAEPPPQAQSPNQPYFIDLQSSAPEPH